ncbi:phosphate:acyl-[acyl carrier protein] acyltransferase [Roseinatronobacter thiooxidans]|uniref:Phosphate acyltransferase n=2 Tax=Roseinatronobacter thiooxidans TaxID=121821 RepID=A0A2W7QLM1_9RHOB|nr:phosphate:acyl-[acyl carrier protein] acyltransferase [Roseinatronobacter thiooxidans]
MQTERAKVTISVDAMGGDHGPAAVVEGCALSAAKNGEIAFILHGDEAVLKAAVARYPVLADITQIHHSPGVVQMGDKPSQVMRRGRETSMWSALTALRDHHAQAAVSCGNTGALMAVSMLRLRKLDGVHRPAIACLWPSRGKSGFNTMLDVGADVRADEDSLLQYALMGAAYYRNAFDAERPRVGLLNVGTEEHKGRAEIKEAARLIAEAAEIGRYEFVGFVEGNDLPSEHVDVIVTDGFTGNVALKTGEGTARLIGDTLREELTANLPSKLAALFASAPLGRLRKRMDPRRMNGGVFLGLNGTVVKSHGSADATGISAAIKLAFTLARSGFQDRMAERLASVADAQQEKMLGKDDTPAQDGSAEGDNQMGQS